jgi:uncharacterized SAM-binding protein YcdF (DUF218 family)
MTTGLILGAAVWANGPSPTLLRRTRHGAALFHAGRIDRIIVCGGLGKHPPSEARVMAQILRNAGVPQDAIALEDRSTTTGENIVNALPLLATKDVLIVTDWYHAPRARLIAKRAGINAKSSAPGLEGARVWPQAKGMLREIPAYIVYALGLYGGRTERTKRAR